MVPVRLLKALVRPMIIFCLRKALAKPKLRMKALLLLRNYPALHAHLHQFMVHRGLLGPLANEGKPNQVVATAIDPIVAPIIVTGEELNQVMTPHARDIYSKLLAASNAKSSGNR